METDYTDYAFQEPAVQSMSQADTSNIDLEMGKFDLLQIEPLELRFPFELNKFVSTSLQLKNKTDYYVAFKVMTTNPNMYAVQPNNKVMVPRGSCNVIVTMKALEEAPPDLQCKDKFLIQSVIVTPGVTTRDITLEMFNKEPGNHVYESKLMVRYVAPPPQQEQGLLRHLGYRKSDCFTVTFAFLVVGAGILYLIHG